jgi:hypothetical protein
MAGHEAEGSGPVPALLTIEDVESEVDAGSLQIGDVVFVEALFNPTDPDNVEGGWVLVLPDLLTPAISPTVEDFESVIEPQLVTFTVPGLLTTGGTVVIVEGCGTGVLSSQTLSVSTNPRSDVDMYVISGQGDDSNMEAPLVLTDLISTPTVP